MNLELKFKVKRIEVELFVLLLIFIKPVMASTYPVLDNFINLARMAALVYLLARYFIGNHKLHRGLIYVGAYCIGMILPTIMYNGAYVKMGNYVVSALSAFMILLAYRKNMIDVIKITLFIFEVYIFINLFLMIIFPNGMYISENYKSWLLGMKNNFASYFLCAMCMRQLYDITVYGKIKWRWLYAALIISAALGGSSTLFVVMGVYFLLLYLSVTRFSKFINYYSLTVIYLVGFFSIVIFRLQNLFAFIIVDILNKDLTFTNRTYMWDKAIDAFMDNKLFGVGIQTGERWSKYIILEHSQVHNQILDYAFNGGIFLLIMVVLLNAFICKKLLSQKYDKAIVVLSIVTFLYHMTMLTESLYAFWMYLVFFIGLFAEDLVKARNSVAENTIVND